MRLPRALTLGVHGGDPVDGAQRQVQVVLVGVYRRTVLHGGVVTRGAKGGVLQPCGTRAAYARGCRCADCTQANADRRRRQYLEDPEKYKEAVHVYYDNNRDAVLLHKKEYYADHKPEFLVRNTLRRARFVGADGVHTVEDIEVRKRVFDGLCAYCGCSDPDTIDHGQPLSCGGSNYPDNLFPACRNCNFEKHTSTSAEYLAYRRSRNQPIHSYWTPHAL